MNICRGPSQENTPTQKFLEKGGVDVGLPLQNVTDQICEFSGTEEGWGGQKEEIMMNKKGKVFKSGNGGRFSLWGPTECGTPGGQDDSQIKRIMHYSGARGGLSFKTEGGEGKNKKFSSELREIGRKEKLKKDQKHWGERRIRKATALKVKQRRRGKRETISTFRWEFES